MRRIAKMRGSRQREAIRRCLRVSVVSVQAKAHAKRQSNNLFICQPGNLFTRQLISLFTCAPVQMNWPGLRPKRRKMEEKEEV
jgi:hypothetical protein